MSVKISKYFRERMAVRRPASKRYDVLAPDRIVLHGAPREGGSDARVKRANNLANAL
jgi:hypothetical protein